MTTIRIALCLSLSVSAFAQQSTVRSYERITAPVRNAGIYHVATGTWSRPNSAAGAPSALLGPTMDTVYACTSVSGYFAPIDPGEVWTASGRIPSSSSPDTLWNPSGVLSLGSAHGCANSYQIDGFQIGYCTDQAGPNVRMTVAFFESWNPVCTSSLAGATPQGGPFALTGLPGRGSAFQSCWTLSIDLSATSASFAFQADGNGVFNALTNDGFGWSFSFPSVTSSLAGTGPMLAGAPSDATGPGTSCNLPHPGAGWLQFPPSHTDESAGYDGRCFDSVPGACSPTWPFNLSSFAFPPLTSTTIEGGSDMLGADSFRIDGGSSPFIGCRNFGGPATSAPPNGPYSNFHLEMYAKANCPLPLPGAPFCAGDGLASPPTAPCPCGNFGVAGNGCASSFSPRGANLSASGTISLDDVRLLGLGMQPVGVCIFLKGDTVNANAATFGDGITCVAGTLIRLRAETLVAGSATFPDPAGPASVTLSSRGGNTVGSGQLAAYTVFYRNAAAAFCPPATFNASNDWQITW